MNKRQKRTALLEKDLSEAGSRVADTVTDLAEQAWTLAREVGQVASPALQHSAESLARALERAADSKVAKAGEQQAAEIATVARERLADASEKFAEVIRPKPKKRSHWVRNSLIGIAVLGGAAAGVAGSPLRSKLIERLFGPPPDDEPESITLPGADVSAPPDTTGASPSGAASAEGNGVPSTTGAGVDTTQA